MSETSGAEYTFANVHTPRTLAKSGSVHQDVRNMTNPSLDDLLFDLLDHLINPDLNFLFRLLLLLSLNLLSAFLAFRRHLFLAARAPRVPLVDEPLAKRDELGADVALLRSVLLLERAAVFPEVAPDLALLLLRKQAARTGPPEELLEAVEDVLLDFLATEVPESIAILELQMSCLSVKQPGQRRETYCMSP